jgi:hypothetical protein
VTRVIHWLDAQGRPVKIEWEPATHVGARHTCIVQTHELIRRANLLLFELDHWNEKSDRSFGNEERAAGYRMAIEDLRVCEQIEAMRNAIVDLRPYLAVMARGAING